jgi:FkbM family methyltransferase
VHHSAFEHIRRCVRTYLNPGQKYQVVDFGSRISKAGHPNHRNALSGFEIEYTGVDVRAGDNVDVVMEQPYVIPLPDQSADVVLSGQVFEHVPFFWVAFLEMARVLRPGGFIFLTAPSRGHIHSHPYDGWRFYPDAYRALAAFANLRLVYVHTDFPAQLPTTNRFDYANIPAGTYWGDTVGVFKKTEEYSQEALNQVREPLVAWANKFGDIKQTNAQFGHTRTVRLDKDVNFDDAAKTVTHARYMIEFPYNPSIIDDKVLSKMQSGRYEHREATASLKFVQEGEKILELGGGLGFISTLLMQRLKPASYTLVEADPRLIPIIAETHRLNRVTGVKVLNCVATSDPELIERGSCELSIASTFWGSSLKGTNARTVSVGVTPLSSLVEEQKTSVLIADIEGGEVDLFRGIDMPSVNVVILELHPTVIGVEGVASVREELARIGLHAADYDEKTNVGVFLRSKS